MRSTRRYTPHALMAIHPTALMDVHAYLDVPHCPNGHTFVSRYTPHAYLDTPPMTQWPSTVLIAIQPTALTAIQPTALKAIRPTVLMAIHCPNGHAPHCPNGHPCIPRYTSHALMANHRTALMAMQVQGPAHDTHTQTHTHTHTHAHTR